MTKTKQQLYEGMYILTATLSEEARGKALERISTEIQTVGGEVHKVHDQGRKKLAYEIRGAKEGHYFLLYFSVPATSVNDLWREYHLNEDLLRFMMLKAEEVREEIEFKKLPE